MAKRKSLTPAQINKVHRDLKKVHTNLGRVTAERGAAVSADERLKDLKKKLELHLKPLKKICVILGLVGFTPFFAKKSRSRKKR